MRRCSSTADPHLGYLLAQGVQQEISKASEMFRVPVEPRVGDLQGLPHPDGQRHGDGSGAHAPLLPPAGQQRPGPQDPDALGRTGCRSPSGRRSCAQTGSGGQPRSSSTSTGMRPIAWVASVWRKAPARRQTSAISRTGCTTPISLLASITETARVSSSTLSASCLQCPQGRPSRLGRWRLGRPSLLRPRSVSSTAGCSVATETSFSRPGSFRFRQPRSAKLQDSVAPDTNTISSSSAFSAKCCLGRSGCDGVPCVPAETVGDAVWVPERRAPPRSHRLSDLRRQRCGGLVVEVDRAGAHPWCSSPCTRTAGLNPRRRRGSREPRRSAPRSGS